MQTFKADINKFEELVQNKVQKAVYSKSKEIEKLKKLVKIQAEEISESKKERVLTDQ